MFFIDEDTCTECDSCIDACPCDAISVVDGHHKIDPELCVECGACYDACEYGSIFESDMPPDDEEDYIIPKKDI